MKRYVWGVLIAMTQGLNAVAGGNPDQTFSGRCAIDAANGSRWGIIREAFVDLLFAVITGERDHCRNSIEYDEI